MQMTKNLCCQKKLLLLCLPAHLPFLLYAAGYLPSRPAQPAPDPHALDNYKPANWSRLRALPWSLHLPPSLNTSTCSWPVLDPWHPDILKYVTDRPGDRVNCTNKQASLLYTSMNRLVINTTALQELHLKREDVSCTFVYTDTTDGKVGDGPVVELEGEQMDLSPRSLSLLATCKHTKTERLLYQNVLLYVPARTEQPIATTSTQYSVSILMIDATSQMNMIRTLPKTRTVVQQLGGLVFQGYHRVAYNSNPNVRALMTGSSNLMNATAGEEFVPSKYRRRGWTSMFMQDASSIRQPLIGHNFSLNYEAAYQWLHRTGERYRSDHGIAWLEKEGGFSQMHLLRFWSAYR